ncbi:MAG: hypothetical protein E7487_11545 [Ruminococcaceae bacterium]|nr:hypothetical protein [Oscillospiraceae bacterium]
MSENITASNAEVNNTTVAENSEPMPTVGYCLKQIEKIVLQIGDLRTAIDKIGSVGEYGESEDVAVAKVQALSDVVRCRETTNQQLIAFYQGIYNEIKKKERGAVVYNGEALQHIIDEMMNIIKDPLAEEKSRRYAEETLDGYINCLWGVSRVYAPRVADERATEMAQKDLDHAEL